MKRVWFDRRRALPRAVSVGVELDNGVEQVAFMLPHLAEGQVETLYWRTADAGAADAVILENGLWTIGNDVTQHTGDLTCTITISDGDALLWHSEPFTAQVYELPDVEGTVLRLYPTAIQAGIDAAASAQMARTAAEAAASAAGTSASVAEAAATAAEASASAAGTSASVAEAAAEDTNGEITALKAEMELVDEILGIGHETTTAVIDGFHNNNATTSTPNTSPFGFDDYYGDQGVSGYTITKIKLNVATVGTLSTGVVKKTDFTSPFDRSKLITKETITLTETGVQEISLASPFLVADDEYLWIQNTTDTATFKYGANGVDKGFTYIGISNNNILHSPNSVGITFTGVKTENLPIRDLIDSAYKGKTLSILGDSISTFSGYIPAGNATYYPAGTITSVTDTWWKKLIDALGMALNVNNAWSGSRVTTTAGDASAGCMTRCQNLGTSPDVIIVWMGINDFNNNVALGTYDGSTAVPSDTTTFREAYGIMLNKILTAYKSSEVWVCTLPQCERNGTEGFPEINGNGVALVQFNKAIEELARAFGVKVLDHNRCGLTYQNMDTYNPDELHPNKFGHSLVANNDIRQMDGTVGRRYPLS